MKQYLLLTIMALAACGATEAQTVRQPWQGTFTKSSHPGDRSRIFIDLPQPAVGKILTIEAIHLTLGPTLSMYGKLYSCEIESSYPRAAKLAPIDETVRVLLPLPSVVVPGSKTWGFPQSQILLHSEAGPEGILRVSCAADSLGVAETFQVTVAGYLTDKTDK